jgi:hypothetical protein
MSPNGLEPSINNADGAGVMDPMKYDPGTGGRNWDHTGRGLFGRQRGAQGPAKGPAA